MVMFDGIDDTTKSGLMDKIISISGKVATGSSFGPEITHVVRKER